MLHRMIMYIGFKNHCLSTLKNIDFRETFKSRELATGHFEWLIPA